MAGQNSVTPNVKENGTYLNALIAPAFLKWSRSNMRIKV
jgi:hypothetical protein